MKLRPIIGLAFLLCVGCIQPENSYEADLAAARAEKAKHPEKWVKARKVSKKEAAEQDRRMMDAEIEHNHNMIEIESQYRCG